MPPWSVDEVPGAPLMPGMPGMPHSSSQPCICSISGSCAALICVTRSTTRGSMSFLDNIMSLI